MKIKEEKKRKEMSRNMTDSDQKAMDPGSTRRKSISMGIRAELKKSMQNKEHSEIIRRQEQSYNGYEGDHYQEHHQCAQRREIYDFTGSLKDELSVSAIGTVDNETFLQTVFVDFHLSDVFIFQQMPFTCYFSL